MTEKERAVLEACKEWRDCWKRPPTPEDNSGDYRLYLAIDAAFPPEQKSRLNKRHRKTLEDIHGQMATWNYVRSGQFDVVLKMLTELIDEAEVIA